MQIRAVPQQSEKKGYVSESKRPISHEKSNEIKRKNPNPERNKKIK